MTLSMTLLVFTGLALRSAHHLEQLELGFEPDTVLLSNVMLHMPRYPEPDMRTAFADGLVEREVLSGEKD